MEGDITTQQDDESIKMENHQLMEEWSEHDSE
jgi:hypothetical protein